MNRIGRNDPCPCGSGKKYKQCCALRNEAAASGSPITHGGIADIYPTLQAALGYHQGGRLAEAEALYQQALTLSPDNFDALHLLGVLMHHTGRHARAVELIEQALTRQPDFAEAHSNLGEAWRALGRLENAEASYRRALSMKPEYAQAHYNLGLTLHAQGRQDEAIGAFQHALQINPQYPDALLALTRLFQSAGELKKALLTCQRLLQIQPNDDANWHLYAGIVALLSEEALDLVDESSLQQAFSKESLDPQKLERIATAIICRDPQIQTWLHVANQKTDAIGQFAHTWTTGDLDRIFAMPLLLAVLEQTLVTDYRLERLLVVLRQGLLALGTEDGGHVSPIIERFAIHLSLQCFANEYIYVVSNEDETKLASLVAKVVASLNKQEPVPALFVALLGCYQALYKYPFAAQLSVLKWSDANVDALLERQLRQPLAEESIKADIPNLTGIADSVSQAVRQQYEENPYPRWKRRGKLRAGISLREALRQRLPYHEFPEQMPAAPHILIAGCGTGSDAFQVAQSFQHADILAVDISKTSLAYAIRATKEFGVHDIDFRHADILELGKLDRRFDVIVCSGVLHHMHDPMAGWRVLTGLLQPDGYMNIGLYSRRARREVSALRQVVADKGYPATREGISRFRRDVMEGEAGIEVGNISISPDFYSTSACRDLIFHVQEHVYSPLEIQQCLDELGLEFLGFEYANPLIRGRYLARFPNNPACDSLPNWDIVEEENPEIFAGMYQFWVRKRN
ncbi:Tfp pilus assembly protein PilF [Paucimonas lemoignei]|uniref:Tfp pilus assembly protein PilF n=1 Tax=Paucimonas lemoignei TaxID=29443 RepID=A0A4R3HPY0_PAULE|nr:class I SAM-dependent methyltransferase [Paucimonas lemoignei]TCS33533.1 Tfp pilus assembly protein PilF [Paucimonas lemoignei]